MEDLEILQECDTYRLELEKLQGEWWVTLVHKATGHAQVITGTDKGKVLAFVKGMDNAAIRRFMDKMKIDPVPMYDPAKK